MDDFDTLEEQSNRILRGLYKPYAFLYLRTPGGPTIVRVGRWSWGTWYWEGNRGRFPYDEGKNCYTADDAITEALAFYGMASLSLAPALSVMQ